MVDRDGVRGNSKSETRMSNQIRNPNDETRNIFTDGFEYFFGHSGFEFDSSFEFRVSNFVPRFSAACEPTFSHPTG